MRPIQKYCLMLLGIASLILCCPAVPLRAQSSESGERGYFDGSKPFYAGLVAGLNVSTVQRDNFSGYHQPGLNAGATVYWHFAAPLAFSIDLLFSQKGAKGVNTANSPYAGTYYEKYTMRLNYLEVPLLLHYIVSPKWQFGAGASYNALISAKETYETIYPVYIDPDRFPFQKYEIDLVASGSMKLYKGLMLQVRYQYSVTPVRKAWDVPQGLGIGNQLNNMFVFRLAYLF